jgi:hypothetical protein
MEKELGGYSVNKEAKRAETVPSSIKRETSQAIRARIERIEAKVG